MLCAAYQADAIPPPCRLLTGGPAQENVNGSNRFGCGKRSASLPATPGSAPNVIVRIVSEQSGNPNGWRLAASTVGRTLLWFTLPYLLAYYSVMGAWQGLRALLQLLAP